MHLLTIHLIIATYLVSYASCKTSGLECVDCEFTHTSSSVIVNLFEITFNNIVFKSQTALFRT